MPYSRWIRYYVSAVATTPRQPDATVGITAEMVLPIAPNTIPGRRTLYPNTSFPFSNCVHWFESEQVRIRIRTPDTGFNVDEATCLEADQEMALEEGFDDDFNRTVEFVAMHRGYQEEFPPLPSLPRHDTYEVDAVPLEVVSATCWSLAFRRGLMSAVPPTHLPASPAGPNTTPYNSASSVNAVVGTSCSSSQTATNTCPDSSFEHLRSLLASMDPFGWAPSPETPLLPLADLWLNIANHITQEDIPTPFELYEEVRAIRS